MRYKESNPFYHTKAWKRLRKAALERDHGMCCDCMDLFRAGIIKKPRRAEMVHHIVPIEERPDLALCMENLRCLCQTCHNKNTRKKAAASLKNKSPGRAVICESSKYRRATK